MPRWDMKISPIHGLLLLFSKHVEYPLWIVERVASMKWYVNVPRMVLLLCAAFRFQKRLAGVRIVDGTILDLKVSGFLFKERHLNIGILLCAGKTVPP